MIAYDMPYLPGNHHNRPFAMIPVGELLGGILTDHIGPALVFIVFGLFNLVNVLIPLLVREVRELE